VGSRLWGNLNQSLGHNVGELREMHESAVTCQVADIKKNNLLRHNRTATCQDLVFAHLDMRAPPTPYGVSPLSEAATDRK
jgi:hypothetical protein